MQRLVACCDWDPGRGASKRDRRVGQPVPSGSGKTLARQWCGHRIMMAVLTACLATAGIPGVGLAQTIGVADCASDRTVDREPMAKVELYFGLNIPGGGRVEPAAWQAFLDREVTPRFPAGLTVDEVSGQWRDATTGETIREPSRVLTILYPPTPAAEQQIEAIRAAYQSEFHQDSVMRLDEAACVSF